MHDMCSASIGAAYHSTARTDGDNANFIPKDAFPASAAIVHVWRQLHWYNIVVLYSTAARND
jgi:hypothetical protein